MKRIIVARQILEDAEKNEIQAMQELINCAKEGSVAETDKAKGKASFAIVRCEIARKFFIKVKNEVLSECTVERKTKNGVRKWKDKFGNEHVIEYVIV